MVKFFKLAFTLQSLKLDKLLGQRFNNLTVYFFIAFSIAFTYFLYFLVDIWNYLVGNYEKKKIQFEKIINKNRDLYGIGSFLEEEYRMQGYTFTSYDISKHPRYAQYVQELSIKVIFFNKVRSGSKKSFI